MPEHTITTDCVWRNWLGGTIDGLPFAAKICDVNPPTTLAIGALASGDYSRNCSKYNILSTHVCHMGKM